MPVWQKAHDLSAIIFKMTIDLPRSEDYGLTSQIRRSANSISSNIAEGFGRNTNKDKSHFYIMSRGSATETQNHLLYGLTVSYFDKILVEKLIKDYDSLIHELNKIIKTLSSTSSYSQPQP